MFITPWRIIYPHENFFKIPTRQAAIVHAILATSVITTIVALIVVLFDAPEDGFGLTIVITLIIAFGLLLVVNRNGYTDLTATLMVVSILGVAILTSMQNDAGRLQMGAVFLIAAMIATYTRGMQWGIVTAAAGSIGLLGATIYLFEFNDEPSLTSTTPYFAWLIITIMLVFTVILISISKYDVNRAMASEKQARQALNSTSDQLKLSQSQYESLLSSLPIGVFVADSEGRVYYANPELLRMDGRPFEEMQAQGSTSGLHPDDVASLTRQFELVVSRQEPQHTTVRGMATDGNYHWYDIYLLPQDYEGDSRVLGMVQDITIQKQTEQFLTERASLFTNSPTAVFKTSGDCIIEQWNPAAEKMFGYSADAAIGKHLHDLLQFEDARHVQLERVSTSPERWICQCEIKFTGNDGRKRESFMVLTVDELADGSDAIIGINTDVTLQRENQRQREALANEQQRVSLIRGLVNEFRLDLRDPLSALMLNVQSMHMMKNDHDREKLSQVIEQQARKIDRVLQSLLLLINADRAKDYAISTTSVDVLTIMQNVLERHQVRISQHQLALKTALPTNPVMIKAGERELNRALRSVINTWISTAPTATTISTELRHESDVVLIKCSNEAIELDLDELVANSAASSRSGIGGALGWVLAKQIIEMHGGTLSIQRDDVVVTIQVKLPVDARRLA